MKYERKDLIVLCELAIVPEKKWCDRDSSSAQRQLGEALVLLKAGCEFKVLTEENCRKGNSCISNDDTIWIDITFDGFHAFEEGSDCRESETFYIPTKQRMERGKGGDWY